MDAGDQDFPPGSSMCFNVVQEEVAIVRAENRVLEGQLQRAKDSLQRVGGAAVGPSSCEEGQARCGLSWLHSQLQLSRGVRAFQAYCALLMLPPATHTPGTGQQLAHAGHWLVWARRAMARHTAAAEERAARLAEENAALQQELAQRPTPNQYASLQRQVVGTFSNCLLYDGCPSAL